MNKLLIIDGTWLIRRQFHATNKGHVSGEFATSTEPSKDLVQDKNIINVSFIQCLLKYIKDFNYEYKAIVCFDRGTYRYRPKTEFTEYKSDRVYDDSYQVLWDANNELIPLLRSIGLTTIQVPGLEADDLGYYFSHNSEDSILLTVDSDWQQSVTEKTKLYVANKKKFLTYSDICVDGITEPFDIAISKAIVGGHDNLKTVSSGKSVPETIQLYKARNLPSDILEAIDYNMHLSRLDKVVSDSEVDLIIKDQLNMISYPNKIFVAGLLKKTLGEYPPYFLGVIGKYHSLYKDSK